MLIKTITLYLRGLATPPCTVALATFFPQFIEVLYCTTTRSLYALSQHYHLRSTFIDILTNVGVQKVVFIPRDLTAIIGITV